MRGRVEDRPGAAAGGWSQHQCAGVSVLLSLVLGATGGAFWAPRPDAAQRTRSILLLGRKILALRHISAGGGCSAGGGSGSRRPPQTHFSSSLLISGRDARAILSLAQHSQLIWFIYSLSCFQAINKHRTACSGKKSHWVREKGHTRITLMWFLCERPTQGPQMFYIPYLWSLIWMPISLLFADCSMWLHDLLLF